jgi:uncharacterized protein involved in exopolysaccharide biosynthesis
MDINSQSDISIEKEKYKLFFFRLLKKWWIFLIIGLMSGSFGILYAWLKEPVYTAKISFTADTEKNGQLGLSSLAAQFGVDLGGGGNSAFEGDNLIELLKSRTIIEKALLSKSLSSNRLMIEEYIHNHYSKAKLEKDTVFRNLNFSTQLEIPNRKRDSILTEVIKTINKDKLTIDKRDKKLSYIDLSFKDKNELFAKDFALLLTSKAVDYYVEFKSRKSRKNFELLNSQCDSIRNLLYGNIEQIAVNNDINVNPLKQAGKTGSQKVQVNATANSALYTELLK